MKKAMPLPLVIIATLLGLASTLVQSAPLTQAIQHQERAALFPSADMINQGRDVAETICSSCHGMDGISDAEGKPHLAGQRAVYLYRAQKAYHEDSRVEEINQHTGFLNDNALLSVAAYYSSLTPAFKIEDPSVAENVDPPEEDPFLSLRASMRKCIRCHDETGNAEGSGMPNLTAQNPEYFVTSMLAYVDGSRSHKMMKKLVGRLDEASIRDMGVFYAVQEPLRSKTQGEGDFNVGRRLAENCASCHGEDGNAKKAKMPTLAGQDAKYFIKAMKHYKDGTRQHKKMFDAVERLSEQEMIDLATYYATQEPHQRDVRTPLKSTEWIARCERCHGIDGNSNDPRFPMLAGQNLGYLTKSLTAYAEGGRDNTTMHAMATPLSSADIDRIGAYFASQQPKAVVYIQLPCADDESQ